MVNHTSNKLRKRVSFASTSTPSTESRIIMNEPVCDQQVEEPQQQSQQHSCHYYCDGLDKEERKSLCWYSPEDLKPCRQEAKDAIQQLQTSLEQGTLDSLPDEICLRGIEKYADAAGKYRKQRIYIESILQQQRAIIQQAQQQDAQENLANLSRYLSQASTELALFYAARCAMELSLLRHEEEDEEDLEEDDDDASAAAWQDEEDSLCSSQIDVHESKATDTTVAEVCVDASLTSSKRKRSRCHAFGEMNIPPRKIQCCE